MDSGSAIGFLGVPSLRRQTVTKLAIGAAAVFAFASLHAQTVPVQQVGVTAVNSTNNALYNVSVTPNVPANTGALITGTQVLNTDATAHGSYFAVTRVSNSVTSALDLIVADAANYRIVRYPGPGPASYAVSTPIFTWSKKSSGPKYPIALAADVAGNVFAATAGPPFDNAALWVLPFNATTGAYGAPILVDDTCGLITEVVVATTSATPVGAAAPAWNAGDVLILVNDFFNPRVLVYSQASIAGLLANPGQELGSSTAVASSLLRGTLPIGMDFWPADATHGVSLLFSTVGGRVMRFDSGSNSMSADFASGLGAGLQRIKVGTYSTATYAFVSQYTRGNGKILQFGAPPTSGANTPLATLSTGANDPLGLAVTSSGSVPVSACIAPNVCEPLGEQLATQISGTGTVNLPPTAPLLEESCVVKSDPRVTVVGTNWSCSGGNLDVANFCPGFPSTVLPGSMCGHSGPTGSGFVVVKATAKTVDQNVNNTFIQNTVDPNLPLPGPLNLNCPQLELFAWAPRSDLPLIEGSIVEGGPAPGSNYFIDLSGYCDNGGGTSHILSMIAYGLGLNSAPSGLSSGLPGFVTDKFTNLSATITAASAQIAPSVAATVQGYVSQAQTFFNGGVAESASNGYSCAMNSLASGDAYLRANLSSFIGAAPPGNPNPAGEIDGRLANLFLPIDLFFLLTPPNTEWPTNNVPPCETLTPSPATVTISSTTPGAATLSWGAATPAFPLSFPAAQCTLSASEGTLLTTPATGSGSGSVSTGPLTAVGTYSAQLTCTATAGNSITSLTQATVSVIALASIAVTPPSPQLAASGSTQLTATGTYTDSSTQNLTATATWVSSAASVASVSAGLVSCNPNATTGGSATISATGATATATTTGSATVTCLAPVLNSVVVSPSPLTLPTGGTAQLTATGIFSSGPSQGLTSSVQWSSSAPSVATVSLTGLVTCNASATVSGSSTISATSGSVSGSIGVTCQAPQLKYITITRSRDGEIPSGGQVQLTATGTFVSGATKNLTATATWTSSASTVASVAAGLVVCKTSHSYHDGYATISASVGSVTGSTSVVCEESEDD
jgi:Bacterial Ig-like domain (group 2)